MLPQKFQRKDAKTQGRKENLTKNFCQGFRFYFLNFVSLRLCVFAFFLFLTLSACKVQPTDLRTFAPAETLIYLETGDLAKTLNALTENEIFTKLAANKKDFSAFENVQIAVAITGFETSEKQVTDNQSILNFKPRFVAIAETRAWNWQTVSLTENQIGAFVNETYGGEVNLETSDKNGGKWFVWTAKDGRKAFAFVENSQIFFGNDDTAIEKCLAVKRGEGDSMMKNENFTRAYDSSSKNLAFGYVSSDGIAQIADIAGVSTAVEASEDGAPRSFIARILPQILQKSINQITWTAQKTERGIEDIFRISTNAEVSSVLKETIVPAAGYQTVRAAFLPADVFSATRYNLQNPQVAWRSLLLVTAKQTDELSGKILTEFAGSLLEPYGVSDAETFLSAVGSQILTLRFDADGENKVVIADIKNLQNVKKSIAEINFKKPWEEVSGGVMWKSENSEKSAVNAGNILILGDAESVAKCLQTRLSLPDFAKNPFSQNFSESDAVAVTIGKDSGEKVVEVLGKKKAENLQVMTNFLTETRFNEKGIERKTVSAFGFIGTILEQLSN